MEYQRNVSAEPEQVHIALATSEKMERYSMTVCWATWAKTASHVRWGLNEDRLIYLAEGSSTSYFASYPGLPDYTSGSLHSATLIGLHPSTKYFYSCGDTSTAMSSVRSFVTPPRIGQRSITLGIVADLGQTEYSRATAKAIEDDSKLQLVLLAGDMSYADGDQPRWDSFMRMIDPFASRLPLMVAAGNHEIERGSSTGKPFVPYEKRFRMPAIREPVQDYACGRGGGLDGRALGSTSGARQVENGVAGETTASWRDGILSLCDNMKQLENARGAGPTAAAAAAVAAAATAAATTATAAADGGDEEMEDLDWCPSVWNGTYDYGNSFYSFDAGPVHVVTLNPYTASGEDSEQLSWLREDLEAVDRHLTPWIITMFHCPWYHSNEEHHKEAHAETAMRAVEPLLYEHKVALVVTGHVHAYERTHPVYRSKRTPDAPVHLVVGGAGNHEGHAVEFFPSPAWSAFRTGEVFGTGRLCIKDAKRAFWEWNSTSDDGPKVHDEEWIVNPYSPPPRQGEELSPAFWEHSPYCCEARRKMTEDIYLPYFED